MIGDATTKRPFCMGIKGGAHRIYMLEIKLVCLLSCLFILL